MNCLFCMLCYIGILFSIKPSFHVQVSTCMYVMILFKDMNFFNYANLFDNSNYVLLTTRACCVVRVQEGAGVLPSVTSRPSLDLLDSLRIIPTWRNRCSFSCGFTVSPPDASTCGSLVSFAMYVSYTCRMGNMAYHM